MVMFGNTSRRASCFVFLLVVLMVAASAAFAQGAPPDNNIEQAAGQLTSTVTASATAERVRFTSPNTVVQLRLEVYDEAGQKLLDTEQRGGNVLDWHLQGGAGERVADGVYLCVLTSKSLSGRLSQKLGLVTVSGQSTVVRTAAVAELNLRQAQTVGPVEIGDAGLTVMGGEEAPPVTVLANNGNEAQLARTRGALTFRIGDFFSGNDKEQMRLTEEGNLGIGTTKPKAKLDVAGVIRARAGFMFSDGSTLNMNDKGTLTLTNSSGTVVPNAAGTGTQNQVAKWTETGGARTLGDSAITEVNGRVGIGINNPTYRLVVGPDIGPGLTTSDLTISRGPGQSVSIFAGATGAHGMNFGWDEANQRAFVNAPVQSPITFTHGGVNERLRIDTNGNVGIGTTNPLRTLQLGSDTNSLFTFSPTDGTPNAGYIRFGDKTGWRLHFARNRESNGGALNTGTTGELMTLQDNGNVGIGNTAPTFRLHVLDTANTGLRVQTNTSGGTVASFGGNGDFQIDAVNNVGGRFTVKEGGNVGIGLPVNGTPQAKLDVRGDVKLGSTGQFFAPGGEENLRIIRGYIDQGGNINAGSGFTVSRPSGGAGSGVYFINFNTSFSGTPAVTATCQLTGNGLDACIASIISVQTNSVSISLQDHNNN